MAVAEPRLTDYIIGTMKLTRREGDYDAFLALRGVPYPVRLVLQNLVGSTRRFASEMKHGVLWLTETELGTFRDTAKAPVPLDGAARRPAASAGAMRRVASRAGKTWVRDVNPAGVPVRRRWAEAGGSLVCEERELEHEDRVTRVEVAREGGLVAVTVTDQATGTSFRELFAKCGAR